MLALTSVANEFIVQRTLQGGAIGYLLKNIEADELADAIRAAGRGQSTLSPEAMYALLKSASGPPAHGDDLTMREQGVGAASEGVTQ